LVKIRMFFKKENRAKYISHLDINRCWARALKRSCLPVWYTEGFNPHIYTTFPLPISLGYESQYECVDLRLVEPVPFGEIQERINRCLPPDIQVFQVGEPQMDQKEIAWADYEVTALCQEPDEYISQITAFVNQPEIKVMKKTKKGEKEVDIKPLVQLLSISPTENGAAMAMRFATGIEVNINPSLLFQNFPGQQQCQGLTVKRVMVYNAQLERFQ